MAEPTRTALIIATDEYSDPKLRKLRAPSHDAEALARVLGDPAIGGFDVDVSLNEPEYRLRRKLATFFANRSRDDLLLVHFSCHGVKDDDGALYFATPDTEVDHLDSTAVPSQFVNRQMGRSRSRRIALFLDCCYSGAFSRGARARAGEGVDLAERFEGRGQVVITASNAMEYAFEGDDLVGEGQPSIFTKALVEGLETGAADLDGDHRVSIDELYDYVFDQVREASPNQTPSKWMYELQGELFIARNPNPVVIEPAELPADLTNAIESRFTEVREGAVRELAGLLTGRNRALALAARRALESLTDDDSRKVSQAAAEALVTADDLERDQAEREAADRERLAREKAEGERAAKEKAEREAAEQERAAKEKAEREAAERERAAREKAERERAAREKAEREAAERHRAAREKAARDRAGREKARDERAESERAPRDWLRPRREKRFYEAISRLPRKRRVQVSLAAVTFAFAGAVGLAIFATREEGTPSSTGGSELASPPREDPFKQLLSHIPSKVRGGCKQLHLLSLVPGGTDSAAASADCAHSGLKGVDRVQYTLMKSSGKTTSALFLKEDIAEQLRGGFFTTARGACASFTGEGTQEVKTWSLPRHGGISGEIRCSWVRVNGPRQNLQWTTPQWNIYARLFGKPRRRTPIYPDPWKSAVPVP
jgi:Caspase domain